MVNIINIKKAKEKTKEKTKEKAKEKTKEKRKKTKIKKGGDDPVQPVQGQPMQAVQPVQGQPVQPVQPVQGQPVQVVQPVQGQPVQQEGQLIQNNKNNKKAKYTLDSKIEGYGDSNYLVINLKNTQSILTSPGVLIYMMGDIQKGEVKFDGIGKALWRGLGGEDLLITKYSSGINGGSIGLSTSLSGTIIKIKLNAEEEYYTSRNTFLCGTDNITISSKFIAKNFFGIGTSEGFILPLIKSNNTNGEVWLSAYGAIKEIDLKPGETIIVDNGSFLAAPNDLDYTLESLGKGVTGTLLGGEGFGMRFVGSGTKSKKLYIQTKNYNHFINEVRSLTMNTSSSATKVDTAVNAASGIGNFFFGNSNEES